MRLPRFEYIRPTSLQECLKLLEDCADESGIMAGGTDLLNNLKYGVISPRKVVSIRSIPELCQVSEDGEGNIRIGACANLTDLTKNALVSKRFPALHDAINSVGSMHIRNMATIGGNICLATRCWYYNQSKQWRRALEPCHRTGGTVCHAISGSKRCHAISSSDTAPVLMALNARVCVAKKDNERWIPISDFFRDDGCNHIVVKPGEMLTSILIPKGEEIKHDTFIKVQLRKGLDFAIGSIGASFKTNGKKNEMFLVVNSIKSMPLSLEKTAQIVSESGLKEESIAKAAEVARGEVGTVTNLFTSAGYKRQIVAVLVKRALSDLKEMQEKGGAKH